MPERITLIDAALNILINIWSLLSRLIPKIFKNKRTSKKESEYDMSKKTKEDDIVKAINFSNVTPQKIEEELKNISPFQKKDHAKMFKGLKVQWELLFFNIIENASLVEDAVMVQFLSDDFLGPNIFCNFSLSEYPEIKTMKRKQKVIIEGFVSEVDFSLAKSIVLHNPTLRVIHT